MGLEGYSLDIPNEELDAVLIKVAGEIATIFSDYNVSGFEEMETGVYYLHIKSNPESNGTEIVFLEYDIRETQEALTLSFEEIDTENDFESIDLDTFSDIESFQTDVADHLNKN